MATENLPTTIPAQQQAHGMGHAPPAAPEPLPEDPDDRAVAEAKAAVAAQVDGVPQQPQPTGRPDPRNLRVPKARLDQETTLRRAAEEKVAFLEGRLAQTEATAAKPAAQPNTGPGPASPAPQSDRFAAIAQSILNEQGAVIAASKQFDEGAISMSDFTAIQFRVQQTIANLREQAMLAVVGSQMPKQQISLTDADLLARQQADLEARHPWSKLLTTDELRHLANVATGEFAALGRPIVGGPADTLRLRQRVAQLADKFGPDWYPNTTQPPAAPAQAAPAPQPQPTAAQRGQAGAAKLALAANHPPQVNRAGAPSTSDTVTAAQVAQMSTEEIAALPAATRQRLLTG